MEDCQYHELNSLVNLKYLIMKKSSFVFFMLASLLVIFLMALSFTATLAQINPNIIHYPD